MDNSSWSTMKTKYLFSKSAGTIESSTLFVDVYVGHGAQDQRDLKFLEALSLGSSDYYFARYDLSVTEFRTNVEKSLQDDLGDNRLRLLACSMSAAKLRRLLKSGLYDEYCRVYYQATLGCRKMSFSENSIYHAAIFRADAMLRKSANVENLSQERRVA